MNVNVLLSRLALYREVGKNTLHALGLGVYKNTLRVYIKESAKENIRDNKLIFNFGLVHMNARLIAAELQTLNDQKEGYNKAFALYGRKFENNQPVENERVLTATIGVARSKNKDGDVVNILYVTNTAGTKYIFTLLPTPYVDVIEDGKLVSDKKKLSVIWTKAYSDTFDAVLNKIPEAITQERPSMSNNSSYGNQSNPNAKPTLVSGTDLLDDL